MYLHGNRLIRASLFRVNIYIYLRTRVMGTFKVNVFDNKVTT